MNVTTLSPRILLAALAASALAAAAQAQTTWHVPGDAATIQGGLNLAAPGDTVLVGPGTWVPGVLSFGGKELTLRSTHGAEQTILDGQNANRLFVFQNGEGADAVLDGFTLWRGRGPAGQVTGGGAILMADFTEPTIRRCVFRGNRAGAGQSGSSGGSGNDGAKGDDGTNGKSGFNGSTGGFGGAVYVDGGAPRFEACVFYDNRAGNGGSGGKGGAGGDGGDWKFLTPPGDGGNGGDGGDAGGGGFGGALYLAGFEGTTTLVNCLFASNRAGGGGTGGKGGAGGAGGDGDIFNPEGDEGDGGDGGNGGAGGRGGAIFSAGVRVEALSCTFHGNDVGGAGPKGGGGSGDSNGSAGSNGSVGRHSVLYSYDGTDAFRSSILWNNAAPAEQIAPSLGAGQSTTYCIGDVALPGAGNLTGDPQVAIDVAAPWTSYVPQPGSPCIDAGDAGALPAGTATDLGGHVRLIDDPASADVGAGAVGYLDIGAHEFVPPASVATVAGCGLNPPGSLLHLGGAAQLGGVVTIGIHNPLGTQSPFSLAFHSVSFGTQPLSPCGLVLPGFGLSGAGAPGEFLIDLTPGVVWTTELAGLWTGQPVAADIPIASSPAILGLPFYVQGGILDPSPTAAVPLGLTEALRFVHGG